MYPHPLVVYAVLDGIVFLTELLPPHLYLQGVLQSLRFFKLCIPFLMWMGSDIFFSFRLSRSRSTNFLKTSMYWLSLTCGLYTELFRRELCCTELFSIDVECPVLKGFPNMYFLILIFLMYFCMPIYISNLFRFFTGACFRPLSKTTISSGVKVLPLMLKIPSPFGISFPLYTPVFFGSSYFPFDLGSFWDSLGLLIGDWWSSWGYLLGDR